MNKGWLWGWALLGLLVLSGCTKESAEQASDLHYRQLEALEHREHKGVLFRDVGGYTHTLSAAVAEGETLVYQGDMVLGSDQVARGAETQAAVVVSRTWPDNTVPFTVDKAMPPQQREQLALAMAFYNENTNVRFVPRDKQENYVAFVYSGDSFESPCNSYVGMVNKGKQELNFPSWCGLRGAVHELGHVLGFHHEHARVDRDTYVRLDCTLVNCKDTASPWSHRDEATPFGDYDYASVMHYQAFRLIPVGNRMIERQVVFPLHDGVNPRTLGTDTWPSAGDLAALDYLYPPMDNPTFSSRVMSKGSDKCLNVPGATRAGTRLEQLACNEQESQRFTFMPVQDEKNHYTIISDASGKCLDIAGGRADDGAVLMQWSCHGRDNQRFELRSIGKATQIVAVHSGKCVEVTEQSRADGALLGQNECSSSDFQQFYLAKR